MKTGDTFIALIAILGAGVVCTVVAIVLVANS